MCEWIFQIDNQHHNCMITDTFLVDECDSTYFWQKIVHIIWDQPIERKKKNRVNYDHEQWIHLQIESEWLFYKFLNNVQMSKSQQPNKEKKTHDDIKDQKNAEIIVNFRSIVFGFCFQ